MELNSQSWPDFPGFLFNAFKKPRTENSTNPFVFLDAAYCAARCTA